MTVTVDSPTGTENTDGPAVAEVGASTSPALPVDVPATDPPAAPPAVPQPAPPPASPSAQQPAPGVRSDEELLAVLNREIDRTGKRPSRKDVMTLTRVGNDRAIRLLARLDEQHGWNAAPVKRGTGQRAGRTARARTAPTPDAAPSGPAPAENERGTGTGPDAPTSTSTPPVPVPAGPAIAPVPQASNQASNQDSDPGTPGGHGGRLVSWIAFVFGSVTSVAANVLAARIPPVHAPAHWTPSIAAEVGAAVFPLALLLSVEVLSRVRTPNGGYWKLAKIGGTIGVAGGSAVISYGHINEVLTSWHYSGIGAGVGPLVIDGLMIISGFALLALSRRVPVPSTPVPAERAGTR